MRNLQIGGVQYTLDPAVPDENTAVVKILQGTVQVGEMTRGSVNVTVFSSYLDTLAEGNYTLKVTFIGGEVNAEMTIQHPTADSTPTVPPTNTGTQSPQTNDNNHPSGVAALFILAVCGCLFAIRAKKKAQHG